MKNFIGLIIILMPISFGIGMLYPPMMIGTALLSLVMVICGLGLTLSMDIGDFR